ncbi:MAG: FG-GAP-like repeat-containing protein [Myxococcota bacterium]
MRTEASAALLPDAPAPARPERVTWRGWEVPTWRDPRVPFAGLLILYAVLGFTFLGFNRQWWQMALIVGSGALLDTALTFLFTKKKVLPLSAVISCTSLGILLNYSHHSWVLFFPVLLAIGSKHVLTFQGRHVFNPSMFGVAVSLLATRELITAAPAYQWAGGDVTMSLFLATAALTLFVFRGVGRGPLVVSFLCFYALQTALRAYVMRHHLPWQTLFLGTLESPPFYLFTFYMLTDPATSPKTPRGQVAFAFVLTVVDGYLHFKESVYTFFYAALALGTGKFLFLHGRELWRKKGSRLRQAWDRDFARRLATVAALAFAMVGGWALAEAPLGPPVNPGFRFERVDVGAAGLGSTMGRTLEEVDPRVHHIAKWVLSVGDAVAAGDVDGDGRVDVLLTHPLARPEDRLGLYLNRGDFRFERVGVPGFDVIAKDPATHGLASGGVFADDDGDGDLDLILTVAFGRTRRFVNRLKETGSLSFEDVSAASGLDEHTVSLAAAFLDFDGDGKLDLLVANALTTHLPDYEAPTPLNLFKLPPPAFEGDRRMFRFMHNGWHDADNGGKNVLYRGRGDGTYEKLDADAWGLPETHWTLAIGTHDFNHDGWTDLYLASDFGHDDLYLNEAGKHFRRVEGPRFGDVGKDTYKGMNVSIADFDHDGWGDVYVSNVHHALQSEGSLLWMVRPGKDAFVPDFTDEATQRGALNERRFGWGAAAGDLDLDGWDDLVQANGMVDDRLDARELGTRRRDYWYVNQKLMQSGPEIHTYADRWGDIRGRHIYPNEARRAYLNRGGLFVDVAQAVGLDDPDNSRGVLLSDLDGDGDLDALITNQHGPASLYRNQLRRGGQGPHWLALELHGAAPVNLAAIGTRVTVKSTSHGKPLVQTKELQSMGGFSASADGRLVFGLSDDAPPEVEVTVAWHRGATQTLKLQINRLHVLRP